MEDPDSNEGSSRLAHGALGLQLKARAHGVVKELIVLHQAEFDGGLGHQADDVVNVLLIAVGGIAGPSVM